MGNPILGIETEATVRDPALASDEKEAIVDMLAAAGHAANGAPDKLQAIAEAVQALAIFQSRQARHETRRRADDIAAHVANCPFRQASGVALVAWRYRRHLTAVAAVAVASMGIRNAQWLNRLMDIIAAASGVGAAQ